MMMTLEVNNMSTEMTLWLVFVVTSLTCSVLLGIILGLVHGRGVRKGRVEGYGFASDPGAEKFRDVGHSLDDVMHIDHWESWRAGYKSN